MTSDSKYSSLTRIKIPDTSWANSKSYSTYAHAHVPLLHESPDGEPKTVLYSEIVFVDDARVWVAGVRRGPLVGREPRDDPGRDGDEDVGEQDVEPDLEGERVHEGK